MGTVLGILSSKTATEECSQRSSESLPTNQPDSCMGSASPRSVGSYVSKSGQEHSMKELFVGSSSWCPTESPFQGTCTGSHRNQELSRPVWWLLRSVLLRAAGIVASGHSQLDFGKLRPAWKETVEVPAGMQEESEPPSTKLSEDARELWFTGLHHSTLCAQEVSESPQASWLSKRVSICWWLAFYKAYVLQNASFINAWYDGKRKRR